MKDENEILQNLSNQYFFQVLKAFNYAEGSVKSIESVAKSLNELFRYFEPAFFKGKFYLIKNLKDRIILNPSTGTNVFDKSILTNRTSGLLAMQVFQNETYKIWENEEVDDILSQNDSLIYCFENNKELLYANGQVIDITIYNEGSRYATQFNDLLTTLQKFGQHKIYYSSCTHFSQSWADDNRLFFRGGGRGNNIPEKYMQLSLYEYLTTVYSARGITFETSREYNIVGDFSKPKPVDIKLTWREANRIAIIEVKFLGSVKTVEDKLYSHSDDRANEGITQLKEYYDKLLNDFPTSITKAYLMVIDGRRYKLRKKNTTISHVNGMYYKDVEIVINAGNNFHDSVPGFEKPIKVFAAPVTI